VHHILTWGAQLATWHISHRGLNTKNGRFWAFSGVLTFCQQRLEGISKIPGADRPMDMEPNVNNIEDTSYIIHYLWYVGWERPIPMTSMRKHAKIGHFTSRFQRFENCDSNFERT
jgi:hypothetical protein